MDKLKKLEKKIEARKTHLNEMLKESSKNTRVLAERYCNSKIFELDLMLSEIRKIEEPPALASAGRSRKTRYRKHVVS